MYKPDPFEETYKAGVFFDPKAANGGPYRELAKRAKPAEAVALHGKVLTPEGARKGYVVLDGDEIADVATSKPAGARVHETDGVILPGLIDMHNHPEFNIFAAWEPPQLFANRYRWRGSEIYHRLVRDPQNKLLTALPLRTETRYAEIRALVGGVTAIQGASGKDRSREEALVRNVDLQIFGERHAQAMIDLPSKSGRDATRLKAILQGIEDGEVTAFYLHLAEGRPGDKRSENEFPRLKELKALTKATVLIHGTALTRDQLGEMRDAGAKLVWSPQSNLRLYGTTTLAHEAISMKLPVALGADWLPSGSQSLLAEMKVARQWLHENGLDIEPRRLVEMVTEDAAEIAGLGDKLGRIEQGRPADLLVLENRIHDDPYENVCQAEPSWVELVMVGGDLAYGRMDWMQSLIPQDRQASLEPEIAWGKEMLLDTSYAAHPDDGPKPRLADLRAALIAQYPAIGPIFA